MTGDLTERVTAIEEQMAATDQAIRHHLDPEPPRSIGELVERGGHLYLCLNLTAIGDDMAEVSAS